MRFAGWQGGDADAGFVRSQQDQTGAANVVDGQAAGCTIDEPFLAGEIERIDGARSSGGDSGEPDFLAIGSPSESLDAGVKGRTGLAISVRVNDDNAAVVTARDVVRDG